MEAARLYIHRLSDTRSLALSRAKHEPRLPVDDAGGAWKFWMQVTSTQIGADIFGTPFGDVVREMDNRGYFCFEGTSPLLSLYPLPSKHEDRQALFGDASQPAYLFQCGQEDLFAVSDRPKSDNLPRSPCTQGWHFREKFSLGVGLEIPVPVMPEVLLRGIARDGYYIWRGWSGSAVRPVKLKPENTA